jgi:putative transposase
MWETAGMPERPVRKPTRLRQYDYTSAGMYFITICVQHKQPRFGEIDRNGVQLNPAGSMIARLWEENITRYPGASLDMYVVMPDHMHAVVFLGTDPRLEKTSALPRIIQSFKSLTTVEYMRGVRSGVYPPFDRVLWQRSFNERILRDDRELDIVRTYIEGNPGRAHERQEGLEHFPFDLLR